MMSWDQADATRATAEADRVHAAKRQRWATITAANSKNFKPPHRHKRVRRTFPANTHHDNILTRESAKTRCGRLAAAYDAEVRPKYNWNDAYFSDGSVIDDDKAGHLVGAAVWRARDQQAFHITPNGKGPTNTINRAELAAIFHILNDICPLDEDALIFTDSRVSQQLLLKMLRHPHALMDGLHIHADLVKRIAELILRRAERGVKTRILKVKSHTGILGNEAADKAAKEAALAPDAAALHTPAHNPFAGKVWLVHGCPPTAGQAQPEVQAVSNLGRGLKQVIRKASRLGFSRRTTYVLAWQETYSAADGAHPESSNAMWNSSRASTSIRRLVLKARSGTLYNQKLALRYGRSTHDHCPLCGQPDSVGHILGGCRHRKMKGHYIKRHDKAVRMIHRTLQKGSQGGVYSIMDAGRIQDVLNTVANGKRVPAWVLPDEDPATREKMRPDILRIIGLPVNATPDEICEAVHNKDKHTIQIIEVGYGPDTRWRDTLETKKAQHIQLQEALEAAGWTVEVHVIILGRAGTCYTHTLSTLQQLGVKKDPVVKLMNDLHIHTVTKLKEIIVARRRLESTSTSTSTRRGVG